MSSEIESMQFDLDLLWADRDNHVQSLKKHEDARIAALSKVLRCRQAILYLKKEAAIVLLSEFRQHMNAYQEAKQRVLELEASIAIAKQSLTLANAEIKEKQKALHQAQEMVVSSKNASKLLEFPKNVRSLRRSTMEDTD